VRLSADDAAAVLGIWWRRIGKWGG